MSVSIKAFKVKLRVSVCERERDQLKVRELCTLSARENPSNIPHHLSQVVQQYSRRMFLLRAEVDERFQGFRFM
jgi:hypothetical protein